MTTDDLHATYRMLFNIRDSCTSPNWNGYNADPVLDNAFQQVIKIIPTLTYPPFIAPLSDGSIQLEYDFECGLHLEFIVGDTDVIEWFMYKDSNEKPRNRTAVIENIDRIVRRELNAVMEKKPGHGDGWRQNFRRWST